MKTVIEHTDLFRFPIDWEAATNQELSANGVYPNFLFYKRTIDCMVLQCLQSSSGPDYQVGVIGREWLFK